MKPLSLKSGGPPATLIAGLLLVPAALHAAQLAYEGFDYPVGTGNLTNLAGGSGWNGSWLTVNNGSADVITGGLSGAGISPAGFDLRSIGNSVTLPNNRRVGRWLDTTATGPFGSRGYRDANGRIGATGKTVYLSFVQQPNGTSSYYEFEFHRGNLGDSGRIGGIGNDQSGDNVNLRAPNGTHSIIGAGTSTPNFYVVRIDFKDGNDDVYVYRNPTSATEPGTATLVKLAVADMSFDGLSFGAFNNGRTVTHDEVRVGETWEDVTVPANATPVFTSQPKAATTAYAGTAVTLKAEASGQPLPTYQWYKGTAPISGQTGPSLTLSNLQAGDAGAYHVTATNTQGTATSTDAQVTVTTAPAGLLAYEGFDYSAGAGNLPGKSGGLGWGAAWTNVNGGGGSVQTGSLAAGTNSPNGYDAQSTGNGIHMPNAQRDGRLVDTSPTGRFGAAGYVDSAGNIGADGTTLYLSFLQQPDGATKFYEFEFHRGNLGDPGRIGGVGNDTGNPTVSLRTGNSSMVIGAGNTGVNFYVVRIDYKAGNDDVYVYQNPVSATEPGTPTLVRGDIADMSFNGISLAAFDNGRTVKHDEIRIGKTWSDVVFGTSRRELTWKGDSTANAWNFSANNWTAGSSTGTAFVDGDPVTFDDAGSASPAVNVATNVSTGSLTVNNESKTYTVGGTGAISVSGGLNKMGAGAFTLSAPATFGSALTMDDGTLTLNGTKSFGGGLNANFGTVNLNGTTSIGGIVSTFATININGPTTINGAGALVWIGNLTSTDSALTIGTGGTLDMSGTLADPWVIGRDGGSGSVTQTGGTVTYNPTNRADAFIGASISPLTVASYTLSGGTLEMSNKRLTVGMGPITSNVTQTGGTFNVRQLDLGYTLPAGPGTGVFHFSNGLLTIGAGGITSNSMQYEIQLASGTVAAAADWSSMLDMSLTGSTVTFDTADHTVSISGWFSGSGALTKTGTGTLLLTGYNTHTGATTVSAGTLGGSGPGAGSALTVASGASLAPGDPAFDAIGIFSAKSITLASGTTVALQVDSSFNAADQITAAGAINLTGATATFAEAGEGVLPTGSSFVIVQAGTTLTGTFAGLPEGASFTAGANTFTIHYQSNKATITTVAPTGNAYTTWAASKGLDGSAGKDPAFDADPDGDGISNGLEWILGGNPLAQSGTPLVTTTGSASAGLTLAFTREEASLGLATLTVQWSTNLTTWTDVPVTLAGGTEANGVTVTVNQTATPDGVSVLIPASNAVNGRLFARLKATQP